VVLHGLLSRDLSPLVILGMAVINKNVYKVRKSSHSNLLQRSLRIPPVLCVHQEFSNKPAWFKLSVLEVQATSVSPHFPHFRTFLLKPANSRADFLFLFLLPGALYCSGSSGVDFYSGSSHKISVVSPFIFQTKVGGLLFGPIFWGGPGWTSIRAWNKQGEWTFTKRERFVFFLTIRCAVS